MTYIKRDLQLTIEDNLTRPEIIAIIGPRQSGKTTLMRYIFNTLENAEFISFEDRKILELFIEDEKTFADLYVKNNHYLFIDEIQYAEEGGKKLKYIYDHYPDSKIIIQGSSASGLTIHGIKSSLWSDFIEYIQLYLISYKKSVNDVLTPFK